MNQDGYVRLRSEGPLLGNEPHGPTPILFVDIEPKAPSQELRRVPHIYLATVRTVIVRCLPDEISEMQSLLTSLECKVPCLLLQHEVGEPATLHGTHSALGPKDLECLTERARTAELLSLINSGEAVWEGKNFHFLLPSGHHASAFVRPAHAIRTLRDAHVLALWLLAHVDANGTGIIIDTHTLTSVILALQMEAAHRGIVIDCVRVLDGYPATRVDTLSAVRAVTEQASSILALISVSASGTLRDLILDAVGRISYIKRAEIISLIDLATAGMPLEVDSIRVASLVHLGDSRHPKRFESHDKTCPLCENADTAHLVPVDVDTFDVRFPSFVELEMPSLRDPRKNQSLWEACHRKNALHYEADADEPVRLWRATGKMTWKVDWDTLLSDRDFAQRTRKRVEEEVYELVEEQKRQGQTPTLWENFDLALVPHRDAARSSFGNFFDTIIKPLGVARTLHFPDRGEWPADLVDSVRSAKRLLVLTLGTVTGTTLQRALNEVQRKRNDVDYMLHGIVVHARPARRRTWEVLRNSYANRLIAAYLTLVPDDFSPLRDEFHHLSVDGSALSPNAQEFLEHRRAVCKGERGIDGFGFLWGAKHTEHISPHSIFGELLSAKATLMAVGSAIHFQRDALRKPPRRILFEMPAIVRSYYDPVIFTCMLRWLRPQEMWWGEKRVQVEHVLAEVFQRASDGQRPLILGELLLACAQGKIPKRGIDLVVGHAAVTSQESSCTPEVQGMLELGQALLRLKQKE